LRPAHPSSDGVRVLEHDSGTGAWRKQDLVSSLEFGRSMKEFRPAMMIYVGNLDYNATSDELRALFEPFGAVTLAEIQVKSRTGQSRGFGLVEMANESEAKAAITALNNSDFRDRALTVNESRPRRTVRDLYSGGGWYGGNA